MTAIASELQAMDASIFFAQEMNIAWNPTTTQMIHMQICQVYHHLKMASSVSQEGRDNQESNYQPGSTMTLALEKGQVEWLHGTKKNTMAQGKYHGLKENAKKKKKMLQKKKMPQWHEGKVHSMKENAMAPKSNAKRNARCQWQWQWQW